MLGCGSSPDHPLLQLIPLQKPFQIWGIDIMELPTTKKGDRYACGGTARLLHKVAL